MTRVRGLSRYLSRVFVVLGLIALGYVVYVAIDASRYQAIARARLAEAPPAVATALAPADGDPIGDLEIPRVGLSTVVVQGESQTTLRRAAGHLVETALPGDPGNVVLAGHRDAIFRPLRDVRVGDLIVLHTPRGVFQYRVESTTVVPPTDLRVLEASAWRTLTLITCFPFTYVGAAPDRYVIRAREISAMAPVL